MITDISLSTANDIDVKVSPSTNEFNFVKTIGEFIVNKDFSHGYKQYIGNKKTSETYIWEVLSSVGQDFGESLVQNVKNYINNVSNVDSCHVKALKAMLKMVDMKYQILDKIDYYPIDIIRLIDIFSIDRRYLFNNKYIKKDFLQCLSVDEMITKSDAENNYLYNESDIESYIGGVFYNYIYDVLNSNVTYQKNGITTTLVTRNYLDTMYGSDKESEHYDSVDEKLKIYGLGNSFDYSTILDHIEEGTDSISNYQGYKLEILNDVIEEREKGYTVNGKYVKTSRYFYYIRKRVAEVAEFVDNTFSLLSTILDNEIYDYDDNYFLMHSDKAQRFVIKEECDSNGNRKIDISMVQNVANILVNIVNYIRKIRQKIKKHVRQVYMKGTNNLLKYTVGVFLVDYIEQMKNHIENGTLQITDDELDKFNSIYKGITTAVKGISQNEEYGINTNIQVQEYWDQTEYMNLSTETTYHAYNKALVNDRFFNKYFHKDDDDYYEVDDPKTFTIDQVNDFYLNKLGLYNHFDDSVSANYTEEQIQQKFYKFLDVLFDIGANTSYYDSSLSIFGAKLTDSQYSTLRYEDFQEILKIRKELSDLLSYTDNYEFDKETTIEEQQNDFTEKYELKLSAEYLSAVSALYETYHPVVEDLSSQTTIKKQQLEDYLSTDYSYYFKKSDNEYCLDEDGNYNLDYFLDNDEYPYDVYLYDRINAAYEWINGNGHCRNWSILCASMKMKDEYNSLKNDIQIQLLNPLTAYNYNPPNTENLNTILIDCKTFVDEKYENRMSYLTNTLANIKTQANNIKTKYDNIANTVDQIITSNPGLEQGYYFSYVGKDYDETEGKWIFNGDYTITTEGKTNVVKNGDSKEYYSSEYDKFSGKFFLKDIKYDDGTEIKKGLYSKNNFNFQIDGDLDSRIGALIGVFDDIYYGDNAANNNGASEALQSAKLNLSEIQGSIDAIVGQINEVFQLNDDDLNSITSSGSSTGSILDKIISLIDSIQLKITELQYEQDKKIIEYKGYQTSISELKQRHSELYDEYTALYGTFGEFLTDFTSKNSSYATEFTATNLQKMYDFTIKQDNNNLEIINSWFENFLSEYDTLLQQFQQTVTEMHTNGINLIDSNGKEYIYEFSSNIIEECITDFEGNLLLDMRMKVIIQTTKIVEKTTYLKYKIFGRIIELYYDHLRDNVGTYDEVTGRTEFEEDFYKLTNCTWIDKVIELNEYLDYTDDSNYIQSQKIFKTYSGIDKLYDASEGKVIQVAYDPYYNHKNLTHPSYQIHPFLWNFIECKDTDYITDSIVKYITNIDIEELEYPIVQNNIDKYLGLYGNAINIWNNNTFDYSGWTTRYESSNHVCQYTNLSSEVVDYDGAFYPPALTAYKSGKKTVDSLSVYYKHLKYDNEPVKKASLNSSLAANYNTICSVTADRYLSCVYDIYRYNLDTFGNMYILYKVYNDENPSEQAKLHTPGQLWIRLADNPIAFPAKYVLDSSSYSILSSNNILDISITGDKTRLIVVFNDTKARSGETVERCINLYINYLVEDSGIGTLKVTSMKTDEQDMYTVEYPDYTNDTQISDECEYDYLGTYNYDNSVDRSDVVFIEKKGEAGRIEDDPRIFIYKYQTSKSKSEKVTVDLETGILSRYSRYSNPPISYWCNNDGDNYLDIALLKATDSELSGQVFKDREIDMYNNPVGSRFENFTKKEMNSHDRFNQNVLLSRIKLNTVTVEYRNLNTNADLGYIPSYPGITDANRFDMSQELGENYQSLELLGRSKNIDEIIDGVNEYSNPYLTKEDIISSYMYGRVYEDFSISSDKTFNLYYNQPMFRNMKNTDSQYYGQDDTKEGSCFYWILGFEDYQQSDISCLRIIMYNVNSVGKNPYLVEDLSTIMKQERIDGEAYHKWYDTEYMKEDQYTDNLYNFDYKGNKIVLGGTCNGVNQLNGFFNNKIDNISGLKYQSYLNQEQPRLKFKFQIDNQGIDRAIDKDTIRIVFINTRDFSILEAYHFLDSNGFISTDTRGSYYINGNGNKIYLNTVHLSSYHEIDDIYALATDKRLQFKYSDEDVFKQDDLNYYFPCINVKIPYTIGRYYSDNFDKANSLTESQTIQIFDDNEVYPVIAQEKDVCDGLNGIIIQQDETVDELRVFEDYLSTYVDVDGNTYNNNERYSEYDPQFYQFAHFYSDSIGTDPRDDIEVPNSAWKNVTIDYDSGNDDFTKWIQNNTLNGLRGERTAGDESTVNRFDISALTKTQKYNLKEQAEKYMYLYFAYKKSDSGDGIDLYVNYQNYINTPYIKLEGDKILQDRIEGTYVIVKQDETKTISLIMQLCMYQGSRIYGIKNITLGTFKIVNISDDKPKFILTRVGDLDTSNFGHSSSSYGLIDADRKTVTINDTSRDFSYQIRLKSSYDIKGTVSCLMIYDSYLLSSAQNTTTEKKYGGSGYQLYFTQMDKTRDITFTVKDLKTPRVQKLMSRPRPMALYDVYYGLNDEISSSNGYVIFDNQTHTEITGGSINPAVYVYSGTASSYTYSNLNPSVLNVTSLDGTALQQGVDYTVSYQNTSGTISIPGNVDLEDITTRSANPITVTVTGCGKYKGTLTYQAYVYYTKSFSGNVLGWTHSDKIITAEAAVTPSALISCLI